MENNIQFLEDTKALLDLYSRISEYDEDVFSSCKKGFYNYVSFLAKENDFLTTIFKLAEIGFKVRYGGYRLEKIRRIYGKKTSQTPLAFIAEEDIKTDWEKSKKEGLI